MQLLATAEQMQRIDRTATNRIGIPGLVLMENAGRAFTGELAKYVVPLSGKRVTIVCGKGNNGGDGFVIARHLLNDGCRVVVVLLCKRNEVRGDARTNLDILFKLSAARQNDLGVVHASSPSKFHRLSNSDVIVDAVFGTGFKGKAVGIHRDAIRWINGTGSFVAAVDICSGANASTGIVEGEAVRADLTVTMGLAKIGQFVGAGREHSGKVVVTDISIPAMAIGSSDGNTFRVVSNDVQSVLPVRPATAHKYSVGKVFVLSGSRKFTGAPFMCAQAAMRTGAGAVIVGAPGSIQPVLARKFTEVMIAPLDETAGGSVSLAAEKEIHRRVEWADAVVIGPGMSRDPETMELMRRLISRIRKPLVVDADALYAVASKPSILKGRNAILTPHTGELGAILSRDPGDIELNRVETGRRSAKMLKSVVCLKGSPTVSAMPDGIVCLNSTGNPGMATIGTGDVLAGMIGSLIAQGMKAGSAAYAGVYVHGLAGDLAASKLGERSVMALDVLNRIPAALRALESE